MSGGGGCLKCGRDAITFIRYSGARLCSDHLKEFVDKRFKKQVRLQTDIKRDDLICVAVSGGKDSLVTLSVLKKMKDEGLPIRLEAIIVDEGIDGYRPEKVEWAQTHCDNWDVKLHIMSFERTIGASLDTIMASQPKMAACAYCGVFRRTCLNTKARELGAKYLATGHNLDDIAQSALMNFCSGDLERMNRIGPHDHVIEGLVPRIHPLRGVPEKECLLYALIEGFEVEGSECPYSVDAHRREYLNMLQELEDAHPGTRHSIIKSMDMVRSLLNGESDHVVSDRSEALGRCPTCGEPTGGSSPDALCQSCKFICELGLDG